MNLSGTVTLVTGGGSGLGSALAKRFVAEGSSVVVLERNTARVEKLEADGGPALVGIVGDVRDPAATERAAAVALERFGRLDAVIGTAGITDYMPTFLGYPPDKLASSFREVMEVNVLGAVLTARATGAALRESGGSITFTLSTSGIFPGGQGAVYSVSKAALAMVVKQLAYELAPRVRVNGVVPGVIVDSSLGGPESLGQEDETPASAFEGLAEAARGMSPLRLCPRGGDYTGLYVLLASKDEGAMTTGAILHWDTGIGLVGHGHVLDTALGVEAGS